MLNGIVCQKRMFLIGFNTEMYIMLTNLEILVSALFLTKLESYVRNIVYTQGNIWAVPCTWIVPCIKTQNESLNYVKTLHDTNNAFEGDWGNNIVTYFRKEFGISEHGCWPIVRPRCMDIGQDFFFLVFGSRRLRQYLTISNCHEGTLLINKGFIVWLKDNHFVAGYSE